MAASGGSEGSGRFRSEPHPALRPFVVEYWGVARDLAAMGGLLITPDCRGELICCVDDLFLVLEDREQALPRLLLVGLLDGPLRITSRGVVRCMAARLPAWSVGRIASLSGGSPGGPWRDAGAVFGPRAAGISKLVERCDWRSCAIELDDLLLGLFGCPEAGGTGIEIARRFVGEGSPPTEAVARERGVTRRQVERRVRSLTQVSPKRLACLARFQRVRDAIWDDPSIDLARLALTAGYADQPHMTREFRRYSGLTPGDFIRESKAKKRWLASRDVAFVQERPAGDR